MPSRSPAGGVFVSSDGDLNRLAAEVDQIGADSRIELAEERSRQLSDHLGLPVETNYTGIEIPDDAAVHVMGTWPNGEQVVVRTYWRH